MEGNLFVNDFGDQERCSDPQNTSGPSEARGVEDPGGIPGIAVCDLMETIRYWFALVHARCHSYYVSALAAPKAYAICFLFYEIEAPLEAPTRN